MVAVEPEDGATLSRVALEAAVKDNAEPVEEMPMFCAVGAPRPKEAVNCSADGLRISAAGAGAGVVSVSVTGSVCAGPPAGVNDRTP